MKKVTYSIFAAMLFFAATLTASAQTGQTRQVSGFNALASSGPFDVHVNINGTESLKISANADIINEIETQVEDGKLEIKFKNQHKWSHNHTGRIDIYVTAKALSSLVSSGSGFIKVEGALTGERVTVVLSGSGDIESAVKSGNLSATISGSGNIRLKGSAGDTKVAISGSGELMGKELRTEAAAVSISGSGSTYIKADKSISASIIGSGNVVYSGNASVTDSRTIGSGRISKEE